MWTLIQKSRGGQPVMRQSGVPTGRLLTLVRRLPCHDGDVIELLAPDDAAIADLAGRLGITASALITNANLAEAA